MNLEIKPIPALSDNYIWALVQDEYCILVDPGEAAPAMEFLDTEGLKLAALLLTHHHPDHVGGVEAIRKGHPCPAWGPADPRMPAGISTVSEGDHIELAELGLSFETIETPGHTSSHVIFHAPGILLSGDTLFSAGCGRIFEGTPEQMLHSLDKLAALPGETRFYCGHEYTEANARFALEVEPDNPAVRDHLERARELGRAGLPTLPDTLEHDRQVNPFLRTREPAVAEAARRREKLPDQRPESVFGAIRRWKDQF